MVFVDILRHNSRAMRLVASVGPHLSLLAILTVRVRWPVSQSINTD